MVERRIVTKNKAGEVIKIVEHHDPNAEHKLRLSYLRFGVAIGSILTALVMLAAVSRFRLM